MIAKLDLLQALKDTLENPEPHSAICSNVWGRLFKFPQYQGGIAAEVENSLNPLFERWPKFSGDSRYPVPSPKGCPPKDEFSRVAVSSDNFWEGEYGALRWELLEFCIDQLENEDHGT